MYESNLIISAAAECIKACNGTDKIYSYLAPPDLFNRRQESGKSVADIFSEHGIALSKTSNKRVNGWLAVKEWIKPYKDETETLTSALKIFPGCVNLIRTLPAVLRDPKNYDDVANEPHELTHAPDALRGFCVSYTSPTRAIQQQPKFNFDFEKPKKKPGGQGTKSRAI